MIAPPVDKMMPGTKSLVRRPGECTVTYLADRSVFLRLAAALSVALGAASVGCVGLDAGVDYPSDLPDPGEQLTTPEGDPDPSVRLNGFVIKDEVCKGLDTHPVTQRLGPEDLARFLETQGVKIEPRKARDNLYWFDFPTGEAKDGEPPPFLRLRLAVLDDHFASTRDLQESLLDHGPGWWGLRRSNLAVLIPKTSLSEGVAFALKHKLVCWGMFEYAGTDDVYTVPGPYTEL